MEFILDHALAIVPITALLAIASMSFYLRGGGKGLLATAIALALAAALIGLLAFLVPTPNQLIRKQLDQVVDAFQRGDSEAVLQTFSDDYFDGTRNKKAIDDLVREHMARARLRSVYLTGVSIAKQPSGRRQARFVAHIAGAYRGEDTGPDSYPVRLEIEFVLTGGDWKIASVRRYDLVRSAVEIPLDRVP